MRKLIIKNYRFNSFKLSPIVRMFSKAPANAGNKDFKNKTEAEWKATLTPEQFRILRQKGTERAFTGEYDKHFQPGTYHCAGCNAPLFTADSKFDSGCGWPAFFECIPGAVSRHEDLSLGMRRIEITCSKCGGHLGHVFQGENHRVNGTIRPERHCVNSISIKFAPK